jgi:hypothetical protein
VSVSQHVIISVNRIIICASFSLVTEGPDIAKDISAQVALINLVESLVSQL